MESHCGRFSPDKRLNMLQNVTAANCKSTFPYTRTSVTLSVNLLKLQAFTRTFSSSFLSFFLPRYFVESKRSCVQLTCSWRVQLTHALPRASSHHNASFVQPALPNTVPGKDDQVNGMKADVPCCSRSKVVSLLKQMVWFWKNKRATLLKWGGGGFRWTVLVCFTFRSPYLLVSCLVS